VEQFHRPYAPAYSYPYNENGSINNIDMTGAIPTGVDTRKHYSYDISGRINEITYSTP
jgi:hypothetical protein